MVERTMTGAAAALVLSIILVFQGIEVVSGSTPPELQWQHAGWRIPVVVIALLSLFASATATARKTVRGLLHLLAASVMIMIFGLFSVAVLHPQGDPEHMVRGIIMATFAVSLLSLSGAREVAIHFSIGLAMSLAWLGWRGVDLGATLFLLVDPLMMVVIAMIAAELFYCIRARQFKLQEELRRKAGIDALTGLLNRREMEQRIAQEISRSRRHSQPLSLVIGDLDRFKRVNDRFGHTVGDQVLRAVGERMRENLRAEDMAVRWGGEEFLLLLPSTDLDQAVQVADKIRQAVAARPIEGEGQSVAVTISLGVAQLRDDRSEGVADLIRRADDAMYRAKSEGRDRVCV